MGIVNKIKEVFNIDTEAKEAKTLWDISPYYRVEDDLIILKDGRVAIGYEFIGSEFELMTDQDYTGFVKLFETAALTMPKNYIIQKMDIYDNAKYPFGRNPNAYEDKGYFEKEAIRHFSLRPVLRQKSYIFVISNNYSNKKTNPLNSTMVTGNNLFKTEFNDLEKRIIDLRDKAKQFSDSIVSTSVIKLRKLNSIDVRDLFYNYLNVEFDKVPVPPYKQFYNHHNAFSVGEKRVNIVSLEEQGTEIYTSEVNEYKIDAPYTYRFGIDLQCPHVTVTSFYIEDSKEVIKGMNGKKRIANNFSKIGGQEAKSKAQQLEHYIEESVDIARQFISVNLSIVLFTETEQGRTNNIEGVRNAMMNTYGARPLVETFDSANIFFASAPGCASYNLRWLLMESEHAACYINPTAEFISKKSGDWVCDRYRNMVYIDLFNRELNNQNSIVVGPPGSGKSFTVGHFMHQRYERKERQITIDIGGTYKNIFDTIGSEGKSNVKYFEYSPENPISFNPFLCDFDLHKKEYNLSSEKNDFIITVLSKIFHTGGETWSNVESSVLLKIIPLYYLHINKLNVSSKQRITPRLDGFMKWWTDYDLEQKKAENNSYLKDIKFFPFEEFSLVLEIFTVGKYKELLNSDATEDISDYLMVCFDLARIKDDMKLYPIITLLLVELTMDVIRKYPDTKKHIYMDEAWSMLSEDMGSYVEYMFRTIRKCNGGMCIITQSTIELETNIGRIIKNTSETKIVLNHTNASAIEEVGKAFGFTQNEIQKCNSIRVNKECREFFMKQGNKSYVLVLEAPLAEQAMLTSNPVERNHLNALKKFYNGITPFAIEQWVEDYNNGVIDNLKSK